MANVIVEHGGMRGEGRNVTEAKKDAMNRIRKTLSGTWTPYVLRHGERIAVIAREPQQELFQWGYCLIHPDTTSGDLYLNGNYQDRDATIQAAARHLAQLAGSYVGLERWINTAQQAELDHHFRFQEAYAEAKRQGLDDDACRLAADRATGAPHAR